MYQDCQEDELDWLQKYSLIRKSKVTRSQRLCLMTLFAYAAKSWDKCYPSVKRIAHESLMGESTAQRILTELQELKILIVTPQYRSDGGRTNNRYEVVFENLPQLEKYTPPPQNETPPPQNETLFNKSNLLNKFTNQDQDAIAQISEPTQSLTLAAGDPLTKKEPEKEATQEGLDELPPPPVHSVSELSENGKGSAACRTTIDNTTTITGKPRYDSREANRARAKAHAVYDLGLKNKRWSDRADFKKFETYAAEWVKTHPEIVLGGKSELSNPTGYLIALTDKIAQCVNEDDRCLAIWKNWQLEKQAFSPEFVAPELAVVTTTIEESRARFKKILDASKLEAAKNQAAREAEQRANQEKRWGLMSA
jgi:Helix-turn-helix domain